MLIRNRHVRVNSSVTGGLPARVCTELGFGEQLAGKQASGAPAPGLLAMRISHFALDAAPDGYYHPNRYERHTG